MTIQDRIYKKTELLERRLKSILQFDGTAFADDDSRYAVGRLYEASAYSVFAGGKRLRPLLLMGACEGMGGSVEDCIDFACAMELIHTYSCVHDDLPAMDNDDYRRGVPTNHKAYGEAMAILAGDALLNTAYEIMSVCCLERLTQSSLNAMNIIAAAAGRDGMIAGQAADMTSENKTIGKSALLYIHEHKTAALITAALKAGCALGGGTAAEVEKIGTAGYNLGVAFQIKDDILDVSGDPAILGKPVSSDEKNNKSTYVSVYGMEKAQADYTAYSAAAVTILEDMRMKDDFLVCLSRHIFDRVK